MSDLTLDVNLPRIYSDLESRHLLEKVCVMMCNEPRVSILFNKVHKNLASVANVIIYYTFVGRENMS